MERSMDDHTHCDHCIRRGCHEGCPIASCDQFCGAVFHACKQSEHLLLCPLVRVPCINQENGCPHIMPRYRRGAHLSTCPASVICCTNEWNRRPLVDKRESLSSHILTSGEVEAKELDVALMLRDQRFLNKALEQNNNKQLPVMSLVAPYCSNQVIRNSDIASLSEHFRSSAPPGLQNSICNQLFSIGGKAFDADSAIGGCGASNLSSGASGKCDTGQNVMPVISQPFGNIVCDGCDIGIKGNNRMNTPNADVQHTFQMHSDNNEQDSAALSRRLTTSAYEVLNNDIQANSHSTCSDLTSTEQIPGDGNECKHSLSTASSTPVLCLDLTIDSLTRYQPKQDSIFTFMCAQVFRRDQYGAHVKNIHSEIYAGLNGWLVQRCPLACYGCPFSVRRMFPNNEHSQVVYSTVVESFGIQPSPTETGSRTDNSSSTDKHVPLLVELPAEVLEHIARFLDGFSLNNLALTCRLLRDVCYNILPDKGIVVGEWECEQVNGRKHWFTAHYKWRFSVASSPIDNWMLTSFGMISTHLKHCAFYRCVPQSTERVRLPGLDESFTAFKNNFHLVNRYYRFHQRDYRQNLIAQQLRLLQRPLQ
ncbi:hypothetical protein LSH36_231g03017 [Paralvinella palmiformis]|uniref:F-box domain-containing protein n=1 Tax=Paralvinella palmiformis TaxID=53620 RepID=A0AAD9JMF3_9ANNE|nr:hypothetical protein LSH36_231g03017 [Paralvinella palmiformis]